MSRARRLGPIRRTRALLREARRRQVIRATVAYAAVFFVLAQVASIFFPALHLPDWSLTLVVVLGMLGIPVVITLAWFFDLTRKGVVRAPPYRSHPDEPSPTRRLDPARWQQVRTLFAQALERPPAERAAFLAGQLDGDASLRDEVAAMLRAHETTGPLDRLSAGAMATLVAPLRGEDPAPAGSPDATGAAGRYQVLDRIGDGGMGVVYRGRDLRLQRDVALKFLPARPGSAPAARERFLLEARSAAALEHPNICTVHEIGETEDGGLFIAMPLYDGETLDRTLSRGPLHWEEAVDVAVQVARGLASAHEAGIVHRDIKPANLCLTDQGTIKILDFGIAKVAEEGLTGETTILGTAAYMSPEQARGADVDHRTDLWSLGVVLYEMLTGQRLFRGEDRDAVLAAIRSSEPVPHQRLRDTAPPQLVRVIQQMLSREVAARPDSAGAVAALIEAAAANPQHVAAAEEANRAALAPEGERRQATVLVVAVAGYQGLLDRLEPAALEARLEQLRAMTEDVVRAHSGTLNEFRGEQIQIVFGVPVTHEDDALRAAKAAHALHAAVRQRPGAGDPELGLRAGIATGTVVAQPSNRDGQPYRLAGTPPRIALRLAARASVGETLLDGPSERTARTHFSLDQRPPLPADGREESEISVHALEGSTEGPDRERDAEPLLLTTYTGRDRELETLMSCFEQALLGEGQVVTVVGEAGVGKSRLVHEFRRRARGRPARMVYGQCEPFAGSRPYRPFVQALLDILDLGHSPEARIGEEDVLESVRAVHPELETFAPFFLHLLSVPSRSHSIPRQLQGEQFRASMREAITALLTLSAERDPLILILEDWHWVDEASTEVLKQLAEVIPAFPILVLVSYRPGYTVEWDGSLPRVLIHLSPLTPTDSTRLVAAIVGAEKVAPDVGAALHDRSGGNPFFLEELCQSLQEAGMLRVANGQAVLSGEPGELHLPYTIQGVIRTRLDRLPRATREVIRTAAVVGRDFTLDIMTQLGHDRYALDRSLDALKAAGIIQQIRVVPERSFRFKHALTQEVVYDTLLQHRRRMLHGQVGRVMEAQLGSRTKEQAARLALHFSRAEEWLKAVEYGLASASRARVLSEFQDALTTLENVVEWLSKLPETSERRDLEVETLLQQEEVCETLGLRRRQQEILDRLAPLVDDRSDPRRLIEVYRRRGDVLTLLRRFDAARGALEAALRLARDAKDKAAQSHVLRSLGLTGWHEGTAEEALVHIEEALRLDLERDDEDAIAADLTNKSQILKDQGRYPEALECLEHAMELLERRPSDLKKSYVLHHMGNICRILGDTTRALEHLRQAEELSDRSHLPVQRSFHLTAIAHIQLAEGRVDEAVSTYQEAVAVARRARYAEGLARSLRPLGEVLAGIGRPAEALPYLREAAELFGQLGNPEQEAEVWRKTAETADLTEETGDALTAWSRTRSLAEAIGDASTVVDALERIARLQRRLGDGTAAEAALAEGLERARLAHLADREAAILNSLAILDWQQGAYRDAIGRYEAALEIFRRLDDDVHAGLILNSLGATLRAMGRSAESRARLEEALAMNRRSGHRLLEGHSLAALGELCLDDDEPERALEHFEASLAIRREIGDRAGEGWMSHFVATACARLGLDDRAQQHDRATRAIATELADAELLHACERAPV
jgi:tetratricopeptide (TPR) repeat protein/class 3 adenylate cyclase